jgi:hypothetical protein
MTLAKCGSILLVGGQQSFPRRRANFDLRCVKRPRGFMMNDYAAYAGLVDCVVSR